MIRHTLLWLYISGVAIYAFKDWYKSLCGLILLMAVIEHPDMPKMIFGIQGLNPWNLLLAVIVLAWFACRKPEGLKWDMPRRINIFLLLYLFVVVIGFFRMLDDQGGLIDYARIVGEDIPSSKSLWSEYFINCFKWVIPGLLLFDGCRSRSRFKMALLCLLAVYFLLALQVIRWMPLNAVISGEELTGRSGKIILNETGYHRVNMSMMLAGASWAIFTLRSLWNNRKQKIFIIAISLTVFFAQALTGGRTGYATWAVIGVVLCLIRWRKHLLVAPLVALSMIWIVPGAMERMSQGFTPESRDVGSRNSEYVIIDNNKPDLYTVTAGRNIAWPYVIEKIGNAPLFGYGRMAMQRTGVATFLRQEFGERFPHPHNAYFQLLMDNGLIGSLPIFLFYLVIIKHSISLFRDSESLVFITVGGVTLSLVLALLVASVGSQTFYPREGAVCMWCAIGLMLRVFVQRSRGLATSETAHSHTIDELLWKRTTWKK